MKAKKNNKERDEILDKYLDRVLKKNKRPKSIHKFCKKNNIDQDKFFSYFSSFQEIEKLFWSTICNSTLSLVSDDIDSKQPIEHKLLNFYYTLFENLTLHKKVILIFLKRTKSNPFPEKNLRRHILPILKTISKDIKSMLPDLIAKGSHLFYSELIWFQFLSLLKFWQKDTSHGSEKTDVFIEKTISLTSAIHHALPTESIFDYGKFIYKEIKTSL